MACFKKLYPYILKFQGSGYSVNRYNIDLNSKYGLTFGFIRTSNDLNLFDINKDGFITKNDLKEINKKIAISAYKKYFWDKYKLNKFDSSIAFLLMDMYLLHNPKTTNRLIQQALNKLNYKFKKDGVLTDEAYDIIKKYNSKHLFNLILFEREKFFNKILQNNKSGEEQIEKYINKHINKLRKWSGL